MFMVGTHAPKIISRCWRCAPLNLDYRTSILGTSTENLPPIQGLANRDKPVPDNTYQHYSLPASNRKDTLTRIPPAHYRKNELSTTLN